MVASLVVEVPGEPPFEVRLEHDAVSVGRSEENVLGLRDMNVSRRHFVVERRPGIGHVLRDSGSRNGTIVNGVSVLDKLLVEGDRITVGGSALTFRAAAGPASIALADAPRPTSTRKSGVATLPPGAAAGAGPSGSFPSAAGAAPATSPLPTRRTPYGAAPTMPFGPASALPGAGGAAPAAAAATATPATAALDPLLAPGGFGASPAPRATPPTRGLDPARLAVPTPGAAEAPRPPAEAPRPPAEAPRPPAEAPRPPAEAPRTPADTPRPPVEREPGTRPAVPPRTAGYAPSTATPPMPIPRPSPADLLAPPAAGPLTPAPPAEGLPPEGARRAPAPDAEPSSVGRDRWRTLAAVACAVNLERDIGRLLEQILDAALSLVPSASGFLVLRDGEALTIQARRNAPDATLEGDAARLSLQVCREAIAQGRPVLTQDAVGDQRLGQFQTVMALRLKSILCVPFAARGEVLGVVYLDEPQVDPFAEHGEVVELVGALGDLAGIALANARLLQEVAARERLEEEVRLASRIQQHLLPKAPPAARGLELFGRTRAARLIGGDTFDYFRRELPEPEVLVSIGDVAGKGVGAGIVMSNVRALLHAYAEAHRTTDEVLASMNRALSAVLEPGTFVSFLLIRYHEESGRLSYTGAGHEHLVFFRPSTGQVELVRAGGVVLGLVPDIRGRVTERHLTLQPGDVVVLYTDGATEAQAEDGEEFGLARITALVKEGPTDPQAVVDRIMAAVDAFGGGGELHDDLTVLALRRV